MKVIVSILLLLVCCCESNFDVDELLEDDHDSDVRTVAETRINFKGLSGIAQGNGRVFVVSDRKGLIELTTALKFKELIFAETELEGVSIDELTGAVWVCQERTQTIIQINPDTKTVISKFALPDEVVSKNRGFEGIVFDPKTRTLFIVREKHKPAVLQVTVDGKKVQEFVINIDDLSDITIKSGEIFLLSQEGQSINQMNMFGGLVKRWHLPLKKAEGFSFLNNGTFYVVDDEEKNLYTFKFKD